MAARRGREGCRRSRAVQGGRTLDALCRRLGAEESSGAVDAPWWARNGRTARRGREVCRRSRAVQGGRTPDEPWWARNGRAARRGQEVCRRSGGAGQRSADMSRGTGTTWRTAHIAYILNILLADRQAGTNDPLRTAKSDRASAHIRCFAFAASSSRSSRRNLSLLISPVSLTSRAAQPIIQAREYRKRPKANRSAAKKRPTGKPNGRRSGKQRAAGRLRPPQGTSAGRPIRARTPMETRTPRVLPAHVQRRAAGGDGRLQPPRGAAAGRSRAPQKPQTTPTGRKTPGHTVKRSRRA